MQGSYILSKMSWPRRNIRNRDLSSPLTKKKNMTIQITASYWSLWSTEKRVAGPHPKGHSWIMVIVLKRHFSITGKNIVSRMKNPRTIESWNHLGWSNRTWGLTFHFLEVTLTTELGMDWRGAGEKSDLRWRCHSLWKKDCSAAKCINHGQKERKSQKKTGHIVKQLMHIFVFLHLWYAYRLLSPLGCCDGAYLVLV